MDFKKVFVLVGMLFLASQCGMYKSGGSVSASEASVSYARDLAPLMLKNCAPCHFPETGKADQLDNYDRVRRHIRGILHRVQLDPSNDSYMPFKQKKPAWTEAEIALFQQWQAEGFAP